MALEIDNNDGTITLYQGDTGELAVNGLDETKNLRVYFAIRDKYRNPVGKELNITSNNNSSVVFFLSKDLTDLLVVPNNTNFETYYYGLKITEIGSDEEDTLFIAGKTYGEQNLMLVYPKQVEGLI